MEKAIKDSGERRECPTGSVRDVADGKGRFDLLPLDIISDFLDDPVYQFVDDFIRTGDPKAIHRAVAIFMAFNLNSNGTNNPHDWLIDYAIHMEMGCKKYGNRNWERGQPLSWYISSGMRHYGKHRAGWEDEPHDKAFVWNMFGCLWTLKHKPEMNDLPFGEAA